MAKYLYKKLLSCILQFILICFLGPIAAFCYLFLRCKMTCQKRQLRRKCYSKKIAEKSNTVVDESETLYCEKQDFINHHFKLWAKQVSFGQMKEILNLAGNKQTVYVIPSHILRQVLLNTSFSFRLKKCGENKDEWKLSFDEKNADFDVREILIHKCGKLSIIDREGKIHTSRDHTWNLAKAHVQRQLTFLMPGFDEDEGRMIFPTLVSRIIRQDFPITSVLRQFLESHTRFMQYTNDMSWNTHKNVEHPYNQFLPPSTFGPFYNKVFVSTTWTKYKQTANRNVPTFDELDENIAYHAFLKEYYYIIEKYVQSLEPYIKEDYEKFTILIEKQYPGFKTTKPVVMLTTFIWNSCIVYSSDRFSIWKQFMENYGILTVRTPLVKTSNPITNKTTKTSAGKSDEVIVDLNVNQDSIVNTTKTFSCANSSNSLFKNTDVYRTRLFLKTYSVFLYLRKMDFTLLNTRYYFNIKECQEAAEKFSTDLKDLDSKLKQRGEAIVDIKDMLRGFCY